MDKQKSEPTTRTKAANTSRRRLLGVSLGAGSAALISGLTGAKRALAADAISPVVKTSYGEVRGAVVDGINVFKGIPYGASTEGSARFLPPAKPRKWDGIRDATRLGPRCVQGPGAIYNPGDLGEYMTGGRGAKLRAEGEKDSEDCLTLNVLTPGLADGKKRPVMVYIHGGGFASLSSAVSTLAVDFPREQDLVLVSVNHRLNVFGYLYLGGLSEKYADSGNAGMLDLVAALEWVRDNIAEFGGDPRNVTIFGESGGGAKVSTLLAMPAAKGLFHKAIVESGSFLQVSTTKEATQFARMLLKQLELADNQVDDLQKVSAARLYTAAAGKPTGPDTRQGLSIMKFGPVGDGRSVPHHTWDLAAPAVSADTPMIVGCCRDEATLFMGGQDPNFKLDDTALRERVKKVLSPAELDVDKVIETYRRTRPNATQAEIFFAIAGDRMFRMGAVTQADRKAAQGKAPVYTYLFAWDTPILGGRVKAFHTAELPLIMRLVKFPESEQLSKELSGAWASFARHGDPKHRGIPSWPAYSIEQRPTMVFGLETRVVNDPGREERLELQGLPPAHMG